MWQPEEVFARVQRVISDAWDLPLEAVSLDASFSRQFHAGTLDIAELVLMVEDELGLSLPEDVYKMVDSAADVVHFVLRAKQNTVAFPHRPAI